MRWKIKVANLLKIRVLKIKTLRKLTEILMSMISFYKFKLRKRLKCIIIKKKIGKKVSRKKFNKIKFDFL